MVDGKDIRRSKEMRGSTESYLPGLTMGQLEAKNLMLSVLEEVEARIEEWSTHTASLRTMADALAGLTLTPVSYTHLTLPTTPYV